MNRIRKINRIYQVLITPDFQISPDSSLLIGNLEDESLRNFFVLQFDTLNDAQCEAFKYPDIDWYRIISNHQHIFNRLDSTIRNILDNGGINYEIKSTLISPENFKNIIFDRVLLGGNRSNLRFNSYEIINFTILNPWTNNLYNISNILENYRAHLYRDDLRIKFKKILDGKIICLFGYTEYGTTYEIKLIPTLIHQ